MRHLLIEEGLVERVQVDSAGTAAYHVGEPPDHRARAAAERRGMRVEGQARQFVRKDWERFHYVLAMDQENFSNLERGVPRSAVSKLSLLRSFDPNAPPGATVPDPYYGGERGFDEVLDLCEAACRGLIAHLRREHGL